jgi:hypothetical protein
MPCFLFGIFVIINAKKLISFMHFNNSPKATKQPSNQATPDKWQKMKSENSTIFGVSCQR